MTVEAFEFRHATPQEVGELALVAARADAGRDGRPLATAYVDGFDVEVIESRMNRIDAWTYVAACGDRVVGFALSHPQAIVAEISGAAADTQHLSFLMVDPDYWGRGLASRLVDLTMEHSRGEGKRCMTLWTREANNDRAQGFYTRKGFIPTGIRRDSYYGPQIQYQRDL